MINQDQCLQILIAAVNKSRFDCKIAISVAGSIIIGKLAGCDEYFDHLISTLKKNLGQGSAGNDLVRALAQYRVAQDQEGTDATEYIHIQDVQILNSKDQGFLKLLKNEAWWRGKISDVSGFIIDP